MSLFACQRLSCNMETFCVREDEKGESYLQPNKERMDERGGSNVTPSFFVLCFLL